MFSHKFLLNKLFLLFRTRPHDTVTWHHFSERDPPLPDPNGSLSKVFDREIEAANEEVTSGGVESLDTYTANDKRPAKNSSLAMRLYR